MPPLDFRSADCSPPELAVSNKPDIFGLKSRSYLHPQIVPSPKCKTVAAQNGCFQQILHLRNESLEWTPRAEADQSATRGSIIDKIGCFQQRLPPRETRLSSLEAEGWNGRCRQTIPVTTGRTGHGPKMAVSNKCLIFGLRVRRRPGCFQLILPLRKGMLPQIDRRPDGSLTTDANRSGRERLTPSKPAVFNKPLPFGMSNLPPLEENAELDAVGKRSPFPLAARGSSRRKHRNRF